MADFLRRIEKYFYVKHMKSPKCKHTWLNVDVDLFTCPPPQKKFNLNSQEHFRISVNQKYQKYVPTWITSDDR